MDLNRICELFVSIDSFLSEYGDSSVRNQLLLVRDTIDMLRSDLDDDAKSEKLIRCYRSLFCGKAGLSEFYVWDDDFEKRMALNAPFDAASDELWTILKPFVDQK